MDTHVSYPTNSGDKASSELAQRCATERKDLSKAAIPKLFRGHFKWPGYNGDWEAVLQPL